MENKNSSHFFLLLSLLSVCLYIAFIILSTRLIQPQGRFICLHTYIDDIDMEFNYEINLAELYCFYWQKGN